MSLITISNVGNLVKISFQNNKTRYFDTLDFISNLSVNSVNLTVSFSYKSSDVFIVPLSEVTINGIILTDVLSFETAIRSLVFGFSKIDPLVATGFMSAAITAPIRRVTALGNNPDVDQGTVPETIWPGGGLYPWMTGTTSLEVVSTSTQDSASSTGMAAISLTLMNSSYVESVLSVALNGTTPVAITGTWFRINGGVITTKGSGAPAVGAANVGDIIIRDAGGGTVRAIIPAGKGILRQAVFTSPAGYSLQILSQYIGFNRGTGVGAVRYLTVTGYIQNSSGVARQPLDLSCDGESYRHDGVPGIMLPEKTDFAMNVISVSADNSDVTGAFLGVLLKNELIASLAYP